MKEIQKGEQGYYGYVKGRDFYDLPLEYREVEIIPLNGMMVDRVEIEIFVDALQSYVKAWVSPEDAIRYLFCGGGLQISRVHFKGSEHEGSFATWKQNGINGSFCIYTISGQPLVRQKTFRYKLVV